MNEQDQRLAMLEYILATLTAGVPAAPQSNPAPNAATTDQEQASRIDNGLESMMLGLTTGIALLNQQIGHVTAELQRRSAIDSMIQINPLTVDASQDARLDGLERMVHAIGADVALYNQQMADLIAHYQSLQQNDVPGPDWSTASHSESHDTA